MRSKTPSMPSGEKAERRFSRHAAYRQKFVPTPRQIERHRGAGTAQTAVAKPRAFHARRYAPFAPPESGPLVVSSRGGERWLSRFSLPPVFPWLLELALLPQRLADSCLRT